LKNGEKSDRSTSSEESWGKTPVVNEQDQNQGVNQGNQDFEKAVNKGNEKEEQGSYHNTSLSDESSEEEPEETDEKKEGTNIEDESDFPDKGDSEIETPFKKEGGNAGDTEKKIPVF